jgi:hypothetical protein
MGMIGNVTEASDIAAERKCTYAEALEIQRERAEQRSQEYRDATQEIESNIVYGVDFGRREK